MNRFFLFCCFLLTSLSNLYSQDTFSIVAVDSITGEVGSAGASCVDLTNFPNFSTDFLGELFPGVGAINTQAYYLSGNQVNARARMNLGNSPDQIIEWLLKNDVNQQPQLRQYGIVALVNGSPQAAAHTGTGTDDYKNHNLGTHYAIQGNILLGQQVLDSMEQAFFNEPGDLACKLMAALQGANIVGADTRCAGNGSSSLFAFVKVAQTSDNFGNPSFLLSVRTPDGAGIEPIDSLQTLFDNSYSCSTSSNSEPTLEASNFSIFPNPVEDTLSIKTKDATNYQVELISANGKRLVQKQLQKASEIDLSNFPSGLYFVKISNHQGSLIKKVIKTKASQ